MGGSSEFGPESTQSIRLGHGTQVQPLQEGAVDVPLEVEEEAHSSPAEEAAQDAPALEVSCVSEAGCARYRCTPPPSSIERAGALRTWGDATACQSASGD